MRGLDIVVAIDTSKSMLAEDIAPNRLARAKLAAIDLMQQARSDRLGLVAFAGRAFLQCPLTADDAAFRQSVEMLDVNIIPQGGTAIAEAINTAYTAFKEGDSHKVLIIFTDGEDNDEGALDAAKEVAKDGLKIFTVGIGTPKGELIYYTDADGKRDMVRDSGGNVVMSRLNETLLQGIANATGGGYVQLSGAKTMDTLYERGLAPLPKSESAAKLIKRYHERYHWPLTLAILLLLGEMLWPERGRKVSASAIKLAAIAVIILLPGVASASSGSALRSYNKGQFTDAQKEYERLAATDKSNDPRLQFNAGTAAYRNGIFDVAAQHLLKTLSARDVKLQQQAYYNLGNALYRVGEGAEDAKQKQESWENALKSFDGARQLATNDLDARYNYEFVKKKLEELKQQQQNKDKQDEKQDKKDEQKQDQKDQPDKNQQSKNEDQKQGNQDQQKNKSAEDQKQQSKQSPAQDKEQDQQDQQKQTKPQDKKDQKGEQQQAQARPVQSGQMTPQQAQRLLDSQMGTEQVLWFKPEGKPEDASKPVKDW
jgi:Ca-activated chloride channel family protein